MTALIKKDFYLMKSQFFIVFICGGIFSAMIALTSKSDSVPLIMHMFALSLCIGAFSHDELAGSYKYQDSLPYGVNKTVAARYYFGMLGILFSFFVWMAVTIPLTGSVIFANFGQTIAGITLSFCGVSAVLFLTIPFIYKFKVQNLGALYTVMAISFALCFYNGKLIFQAISEMHLNTWFTVVLYTTATAVLGGLSYKKSVSIVREK